MKFYYRSGSCAMLPYIVLEDAGAEFEPVAVDDAMLASEEYRKINPRNQVPSLINDDGDLMTESVAIAIWAANKFGSDLIPAADSWDNGKMLMCLNFMASQQHPIGFALYLRPFRWHDDEKVQVDLKEKGRQNWIAAMTRTNGWAKEGSGWLVGDKMTCADALAWVHARWGLRVEPKTDEAFPELWALAKRVEERPSVKRVIEKCGLTPLA
ncbi:MAG: glutathione S-transferase family protein [Rhodospirillaceae bacterium]